MSKNSEMVKLEYKLKGGTMTSILTGSCPPLGSNLTLIGKETDDVIIKSYKKCPTGKYESDGLKSLRDMKRRLDANNLVGVDAVKRLEKSGYTAKQVITAGYDFANLANLFKEDINDIILGFPDKEVSDYKAAGYSPKLIMNKLLKFQPGLLVGEGKYSIKDLKDSGISLKDILKAYRSNLQKQFQEAYTKEELINKKLSPKWISRIYPKEVPVKEVPVKEVPVKEVPVKEVPVKEVPVKEVPVKEVPESVKEIDGGFMTKPCDKKPGEIFTMRSPTAQEVVDYFKECDDIIKVFDYLHKKKKTGPPKMSLIDIFELCIRSGYTSNQFSSFEDDIWYKMAEVQGGYDFFPFIQIMHEIGNYTIEQIKETGIRDIIKYFDDWKKYNIESVFTEEEIFANSSIMLQYVNGYPIEKILKKATYPGDALPEIIKLGEKKGLSLEDFLKKDNFASEFGSLYMDKINEIYGKEGKPGYVKLFEEAKKDIESGSVKFGYVDLSWMRSLESEDFVRFNYPQIADEIFGPQEGGRYEINYSI